VCEIQWIKMHGETVKFNWGIQLHVTFEREKIRLSPSTFAAVIIRRP